MINEDPKAFSETLASGRVFLLDVRTPEEFHEGHIAGATLIDYNDPTFPAHVAELDRSLTYAVYCRSGKRSLGAIALMESEGFSSVHHLEEGILSWIWDGQPVTEAKAE
jgi:rhodanese-related sulfurtransferase